MLPLNPIRIQSAISLGTLLLGLFLLSPTAQAGDPPLVQQYSPNPVTAPGIIQVKGKRFGSQQGTTKLMLGYGPQKVEIPPQFITEWHGGNVRINLPNGLPGGTYWIGFADANGNMLSNQLNTLVSTLPPQEVGILVDEVDPPGGQREKLKRFPSKRVDLPKVFVLKDAGKVPVLFPKLVIDTTSTSPIKAGKLEKGKQMTLGIQVKNTGAGASANNEPLVISCMVLSGGSCPISGSTQHLPSIAAGAGKGLVLISPNPAQSGKYRITIGFTNPAHGPDKVWNVEVAGGMTFRKVPKVDPRVMPQSESEETPKTTPRVLPRTTPRVMPEN